MSSASRRGILANFAAAPLTLGLHTQAKETLVQKFPGGCIAAAHYATRRGLLIAELLRDTRFTRTAFT